eukprot:CAMPEP_0204365572 /NCGR_PEP_ID=MMETSP0469-20131031/42010_1 /ASSEMBLY_ACC=CAM_ASM_000384 /TAXON_ID=2969 /ORGANISM="Oxyrrhis marina" /LENGTH=500 /DNA_ID=CAMNT_0051354649 /DNA_START=1 /DNA_END=1503 /DNA_ORIENTATION=+
MAALFTIDTEEVSPAVLAAASPKPPSAPSKGIKGAKGGKGKGGKGSKGSPTPSPPGSPRSFSVDSVEGTEFPFLARYLIKNPPKSKGGGRRNFFTNQESSESRCWVCARSDHESQDCMHKRCFQCGQEGHERGDCDFSPAEIEELAGELRWEYEQSRDLTVMAAAESTCVVCGEKGHTLPCPPPSAFGKGKSGSPAGLGFRGSGDSRGGWLGAQRQDSGGGGSGWLSGQRTDSRDHGSQQWGGSRGAGRSAEEAGPTLRLGSGKAKGTGKNGYRAASWDDDEDDSMKYVTRRRVLVVGGGGVTGKGSGGAPTRAMSSAKGTPQGSPESSPRARTPYGSPLGHSQGFEGHGSAPSRFGTPAGLPSSRFGTPAARTARTPLTSARSDPYGHTPSVATDPYLVDEDEDEVDDPYGTPAYATQEDDDGLEDEYGPPAYAQGPPGVGGPARHRPTPAAGPSGLGFLSGVQRPSRASPYVASPFGQRAAVAPQRGKGFGKGGKGRW